MRAFFSIRSLLWPVLLATAVACFYVVTQPGEIYADAYEYDAIARSILHGRFELKEEFSSVPQPTMHREPGYPAFRALVYEIIGDHPSIILWLQALLCGLTVLVTALAVRRLSPQWELPTAWLTALYPGFTVWAGQHYSEIPAAFLVAVSAYAWIRVWESRDKPAVAWKTAAAFGCSVGVLTLTKASFQLLPVFAAGLLLATGGFRKRWKQSVILLAAFTIVIAPWVIRNQRTFGETAITYRTGIVLYTRSLKAQIPWKQVATSYGSVLFGQATMLHFFPQTPPIIIQLWNHTWDEKNALLHQGLRYYQADGILLHQAVQAIFSSPNILAKYIAWSPIDDLRFFELASPLSPKFGVELIASGQAEAGTLTAKDLAIVWGAHAVQFVWWILILGGFFALVRSRRWDHPSLLFIGYAIVMYAAFDNIPRYAVPVLPWIMALIVAAVLHPPHMTGAKHRVLALVESRDPVSGWGTYAASLTDELRKTGADVTMLASDATTDGWRLPGVHAPRWRWWIAQVRLMTWLWFHPVDLIHVMVEPYARLYRAFGLTPFVVTVHGTYADPSAQGAAWAVRSFRQALRRASVIVAVSELTKSKLPAECQPNAVVIPNGVDLRIASEPFETAPTTGHPLILSVGALKARKGFDRLIAGFAEFSNSHPSAELVIIGRADHGSYQETLERQIQGLGLSGRIRLLGEVSRPALLGWYRACDVFALTPVEAGGFEGFGLVYLEANVFGKPCVGSRHSGAAEVIRDGENGILAEPNDPADIAQALERSLACSSEKARQHAVSMDWSSAAAAYERVYRQHSIDGQETPVTLPLTTA